MAKKPELDDVTPSPFDTDDDSEPSGVEIPRRDESRESSADAPPRRRRRRHAPNSGDLFFLLAIFIVALLFFMVGFRDLTGILYSRMAGIVLMVVVIEYLVLKSMDRTRVYQMENQRLRDLRRADRNLLKRARDVIEDRLAEQPAPTADQPEEKKRWRTRAEEIVSDIVSSI